MRNFVTENNYFFTLQKIVARYWPGILKMTDKHTGPFSLMKEKISGEKLITWKCARVQPKKKEIGRWEISPEDKYRVRTPTEEKISAL